MTWKYIFIIFISLLPIFARADVFPERQTYEHHLFIDAKTCEEQKMGRTWFNCLQWIEFHSNGFADVVLTDILTSATYEINNGKVILQKSGSGDIPDQMVFWLDSSQRNLISVDRPSEVWELKQD